MIPHARPLFGEAEARAVAEVLSSGMVALGPVTHRFEEEFARYIGVKYAVGVNSCTSALHLALLAAGVLPDDEVITTPLSWVATANAILYCGAKPVFVDVDPLTLNIDPNKIEPAITRLTRAILPVHLYGQPCDMKPLLRIACSQWLRVVGDCAHAIEAEYQGKKVGALGDMACFSFWGTKNLSTGEGGMVVTSNARTAEMLRELRCFGLRGGGRQPDGQYAQVRLGYKANMFDIQAALGLEQLKRLEPRYSLRLQAAARYDRLLQGLEGLRPVGHRQPESRHAHHLYAVLLDGRYSRDDVVRQLRERGIGAGIHYRPIHLESYYIKKFGHQRGDFPAAEDIGSRVITLPFWPEITLKEQEIVVQQLQEVLNQCPK